jgi:hypothetical protein
MTHRVTRDPYWHPFDPKSDEPIKISGSIDLRDIRDQVRYTSSLLSSFRPVFEQMGQSWACNFVERIIYWRTTLPYEPFAQLSPKEILFLITHEAGHLNFTGGWKVPEDWSDGKSMAFSTFLNAVEDIRIERLMALEFPGFGEIRLAPDGGRPRTKDRDDRQSSFGMVRRRALAGCLPYV